MVKIICISDTHTYENFEVPDGDILIHSGDISFRGTFAEMNRGMRWLSKFPHKHKVFVCGNHDWLGETDPLLMRELAEENGVIYLDDSGIELMELRVWGSPVQPAFCNWAFNKQRGEEIARHWAKIPDDTQVLVTHGPPMSILDLVDKGTSQEAHVGCEELLKRVNQLKDLRLHIFGHLHDNNGQFKDSFGKLFVNAAICSEEYKPIQSPRIITL
jgi:Icc-related predicted phosphoesterase